MAGSFRCIPCVLLLMVCSTKQPDPVVVKITDKPATESVNSFYAGNRAPLEPSPLIKLPLGAIRPANWLEECIKRQAGGLMGNLGGISAWLQKEDNAWLSKDGKGSWGWEEAPYWLKGYANTAYILRDAEKGTL